MSTITPQTATRTRRTRVFAMAGAALVLIGGGLVGYALATRDDGADCDALLSDKSLQRALGDGQRADMSCSDLGIAIRSVVVGTTPGRHTVTQARAMQAALGAVSEDIERRQEPAVAPDLRVPLAAALVDYAQDTHEILSGVNDEYREREDSAPWQDGKTVRMSAHLDDLVNVLRAVSQDSTAYADLRAAHVRQCATRLAEVPADATGPFYTGPSRNCAAGLGYFDGIADDVPESQAEQWRSDVLRRLKNTADSPPPWKVNHARHIAGSWQQAVVERVDADHARFLQDDSVRIIDIWAKARGDGIDSKKVNDLQKKTANDANTSSVETEEALRCTRHPTECG